MCMVEAMPNYIISSTHTSSLVLLDNNNVPIIEFISPNLGFIKENTNSKTCTFWGVTQSIQVIEGVKATKIKNVSIPLITRRISFSLIR